MVGMWAGCPWWLQGQSRPDALHASILSSFGADCLLLAGSVDEHSLKLRLLPSLATSLVLVVSLFLSDACTENLLEPASIQCFSGLCLSSCGLRADASKGVHMQHEQAEQQWIEADLR